MSLTRACISVCPLLHSIHRGRYSTLSAPCAPRHFVTIGSTSENSCFFHVGCVALFGIFFDHVVNRNLASSPIRTVGVVVEVDDVGLPPTCSQATGIGYSSVGTCSCGSMQRYELLLHLRTSHLPPRPQRSQRPRYPRRSLW